MCSEFSHELVNQNDAHNAFYSKAICSHQRILVASQRQFGRIEMQCLFDFGSGICNN